MNQLAVAGGQLPVYTPNCRLAWLTGGAFSGSLPGEVLSLRPLDPSSAADVLLFLSFMQNHV